MAQGQVFQSAGSVDGKNYSRHRREVIADVVYKASTTTVVPRVHIEGHAETRRMAEVSEEDIQKPYT